MSVQSRSWSVLVLFGPGGTGKSAVAAEIGRRHEIPWLQVDILRLALERSGVTFGERMDQFVWFERNPDLWNHPRQRIVQAFIDVADLLTPAVRVAIDSHLATGVPIVIEGDGVHPSLFADPVLAQWRAQGVLRFVCVETSSAAEIRENVLRRGRGVETADERRRVEPLAEAYIGFGAWLAERSRAAHVPVVQTRPYATLADRILEAVDQPV